MKSLLLLACFLSSALAQVDLFSYPLSAVLRDRDGEVYTLHWGFDVEAQTIRFAVNVSTTGWVGLGLSPTGGMPNSDVVIGWVDDGGQVFLRDRFATAESRPPVDPQQNWFLDGGMEMDGFTILAFRRDWVTCDDLDREIKMDTTHMIYAWNEADPVGDDPNEVMRHGPTDRGTRNLNLLGGQLEVPPDPADLQSFDVTVDSIIIPSADTTYWCYVEEVPQSIQAQTHYITKVSPVIHPGSEAHVHHLLIYECNGLNNTHVGYSDHCDSEGEIGITVAQCREGVLVTGWAVGGEEFVYPADVAYPIGGPGAPRYLVMEIHYDNPSQLSGVVDSSGMRLSYTSVRRRYDSGVLFVGHAVSRYMIIPPGTSSYRVFGECSSECTTSQLPEGGINIFASILHTHLAGVGLTLHHLRKTQTCINGSGYEELQPIDQNLQYDFNFQQANHLPNLVNVQPGDILRLECDYNTVGRRGIVLGGESTNEEMCLAFLNYYPRVDLAGCATFIPVGPGSPLSFEPFLSTYTTPEQRGNITALDNSRALLEVTLNEISWSSEAIVSFQNSVVSGPHVDLCLRQNDSFTHKVQYPGLPPAECPYEAPDLCSAPPGDGATAVSANLLLFVTVTVMALAMIK